MQYIIYFFIVIILSGVNFGADPGLRFFGVLPNFILILLISLGLSKARPELSFFVAFFGGLVLDFSTGVLFGIFTITLLFLVFILKLITENFMIADISWKHQVFIFILMLILFNLFLYYLNFAAFYFHWVKQMIDFSILKMEFLPSIIYNLLLFYPFKRLVEAINSFEKNFYAKSF